MAYGLQDDAKKGEGNHVLLYDLGGGTFDVSVLEVDSDLLRVKATRGNSDLGGEDFNTLLVRHFKKEIFRKHNVDITPNKKAVSRLNKACEVLKKKLSKRHNDKSKIELGVGRSRPSLFRSKLVKQKLVHWFFCTYGS